MNNPFIKEGNFKCECGREFTKTQALYAHMGHCKIHLGEERNTPSTRFHVIYGGQIK